MSDLGKKFLAVYGEHLRKEPLIKPLLPKAERVRAAADFIPVKFDKFQMRDDLVDAAVYANCRCVTTFVCSSCQREEGHEPWCSLFDKATDYVDVEHRVVQTKCITNPEDKA